MVNEIPLGFNPRKMIPYNVMIADDSMTERKLLKQFLKSAEFNILGESENGEETLSSVSLLIDKLDILCIDYSMPGLNAAEIIPKARLLKPKLIVLLITSHTEKEIVEEAVKLKVNAFLVKPISKAIVYEKLTLLLGRKDLTDKMVVGYKPVGINLNEIQIPPLPATMEKVISFDSSKAGGSQELEAMLSPDKSICADILRVANSVFYGRSGQIETLKGAITLIGLDTIKNIVIVQFRKNFTKSLTQSLFKKHLNELPLLTGLIAMDLSTPLNLKKLNDQIIVSAILRKVGMTILAQNLKAKYLDIIKLFEYGSKPLDQLEREEFNIDYIQIGLKVFKRWNMPPRLTLSVANQAFTHENLDNVTDLDRLLRISEIFAMRMLRVTVPQEETNLLYELLSKYKAPDNLISLFNEDYYANIKEHPFFDSIE